MDLFLVLLGSNSTDYCDSRVNDFIFANKRYVVFTNFGGFSQNNFDYETIIMSKKCVGII